MNVGNPFATETVITEETPVPGEAETPKPVVQAVHSEAPVSMNWRTANGVQVTLRFGTIEEAENGLVEYQNSSLPKLVESIGGQPSTLAQTRPQPQPSAPPAVPSQPQPTSTWRTTEECAHGPLVYKQWGMNKFGKPYQAFQCAEGAANYQSPSACRDQNGKVRTTWLSVAQRNGTAVQI
jgi:hypothetical protein